MENKKKAKIYGIGGTVLVHVALISLLLLLGFSIPVSQEEGGVPVMLGTENAFADSGNVGDLVDIEITTQPSSSAPEFNQPEAEELLTQDLEETVVIEEVKEKPKKVDTPKTETPKKPEKSKEEIEAEAKRLAEEKAERERKEAAERTAQRVQGAFGKGSEMKPGATSSGTNAGVSGNPSGTSDKGVSGSGGYGSFDLAGRSLGEGGLPKPVGNFQEGGIVVITITVNPAGKVIDASFNLDKTKTSNPQLRKAAREAALKARFNEVTGVNNQVGTITYNFELK